MKNTIIDTNSAIYLVTFQFSFPSGKFIVQGRGLMDCIKEHDKNGIDTIKQFDPSDAKFKRVSRESIIKSLDYDTEVYLYLKNHYFFK